MEQLPQTNPITTSKGKILLPSHSSSPCSDSFTPFSPKDLELPSDIPDSDVFLDQEDDSSEETRSRSGIFKKPSDISKKKYHYIPDDLRLKLIDEVENKGEKIKHVSLYFFEETINPLSAKNKNFPSNGAQIFFFIDFPPMLSLGPNLSLSGLLNGVIKND